MIPRHVNAQVNLLQNGINCVQDECLLYNEKAISLWYGLNICRCLRNSFLSKNQFEDVSLTAIYLRVVYTSECPLTSSCSCVVMQEQHSKIMNNSTIMMRHRPWNLVLWDPLFELNGFSFPFACNLLNTVHALHCGVRCAVCHIAKKNSNKCNAWIKQKRWFDGQIMIA